MRPPPLSPPFAKKNQKHHIFSVKEILDSARPPLSGLLQLQYYLSVYTVSATLKSCTLSKYALYMYIFQGLVCQWLERREDMEQGEFHSNVKEVLSWMITE